MLKRAGYAREEVLGRRAATLLQGAGTDPQAATVLEAAAEQGREVCVEVVHHRKDGSAFCDEVTPACMCIYARATR